MRIALGIEYDGTSFHGWQRQASGPSVQESVELALARIAGHPLRIHCAGRTDAGVHATGQVVHADVQNARPQRAWVLGANQSLPAEISVLWSREVGDDFHARFSARRRSYCYSITRRLARPALQRAGRAWWYGPLDIAAMQAAALLLLGEHDFSAFRTVHCQAPNPVRTLHRLSICEVNPELLVFDVEANAFLHHMVRNLVGSLLQIGRGERSVAWMGSVLESRDRDLAGPTAPASGLCFLGPRYARRHGLPEPHCLPEGIE